MVRQILIITDLLSALQGLKQVYTVLQLIKEELNKQDQLSVKIVSDLNLPITCFPQSDNKQLILIHVYQKWQKEWSGMESKLKDIMPSVSTLHSKTMDQVKLTRVGIKSFVYFQSAVVFFARCEEPLTVKLILCDCATNKSRT